MPAIVLKEIKCITPQDISSICNVPLQSAEYRSKRLKELIQRNKFYTSHLEQQIYNNFKNFIENKKYIIIIIANYSRWLAHSL